MGRCRTVAPPPEVRPKFSGYNSRAMALGRPTFPWSPLLRHFSHPPLPNLLQPPTHRGPAASCRDTTSPSIRSARQLATLLPNRPYFTALLASVPTHAPTPNVAANLFLPTSSLQPLPPSSSVPTRPPTPPPPLPSPCNLPHPAFDRPFQPHTSVPLRTSPTTAPFSPAFIPSHLPVWPARGLAPPAAAASARRHPLRPHRHARVPTQRTPTHRSAIPVPSNSTRAAPPNTTLTSTSTSRLIPIYTSSTHASDTPRPAPPPRPLSAIHALHPSSPHHPCRPSSTLTPYSPVLPRPPFHLI